MTAMGCAKCGAQAQTDGKPLRTCGGCRIQYCSTDCQRADWKAHKLVCTSFQSNACWICKETGKDGEPVYRTCACRGDKGFSHIKCVIAFAKNHCESVFDSCPFCKEHYFDAVQDALVKAREELARQSGDMEERLKAMNTAGKAHLCQYRGKAAYDCYRTVLDALRLLGEENMLRSHIGCLSAFGIVKAASQMGRLEEALEWNTKIDLAMKSGRVEWEGESFELEADIAQGFSAIYLILGNPQKALPYAKRGLELIRREQDPAPGSEVVFLQCLSFIYSDLGQHDMALTTAKDAYKLSKKMMGPSHPATQGIESTLVHFDERANRPGIGERYCASRGRKKTVAKLAGLTERPDLNDYLVVVCYFHPHELFYLVQERDPMFCSIPPKDRRIKPANLIFEPGTEVFIHSLLRAREHNLKEGIVRSFSAESGRFAIAVDGSSRLLTIKPENVMPKYQLTCDDDGQVLSLVLHLTDMAHGGPGFGAISS